MAVVTRKIKLLPVGETKADRTKIYNFIKDLSKEMASLGNRIIRTHINNIHVIDDMVKYGNLKKGEVYKKFKEIYGMSPQNTGYRVTTELSWLVSDVRTNFNQAIFKTLQENSYDIINGKISIPSYRAVNLPIPTSKRVYFDSGHYLYDFPGTKETKEKYGDIVFELYFGKDRSNNKIIVDRTIDGTYKMRNSSMQYDGKDIFLYLVVDIPLSNNVELDSNKVMGIDLGINRPVAIYIKGEKRQPKQLNITDKIQHDRMRLLKQRKGIQESLKYASGGHGRNKKLKKLEDFRNKEKNWAQTINHNISSAVIKTALDYKVGVIQMEDLSGITTNVNDYFLKSWAYFQLQNYIKYKAEKAGIKITWVNPKDTSRECPTCNQVNENNRSKENVTIFSCKNEFCEDYMVVKDADLIAAQNISKKSGFDEKPKSKKGKLNKKEKNITESLVV
jgi:IS605 OrfB family transposase